MRQYQNKKSRLFVLLPSKPEEIMSPANKKSHTLDNIESKNDMEQGQVRLHLHERLSRLVLASTKEDESKLIQSDSSYHDLLALQRSIDSATKDRVIIANKTSTIQLSHLENDKQLSDSALQESRGKVARYASPVKSFSMERKCVRFKDDIRKNGPNRSDHGGEDVTEKNESRVCTSRQQTEIPTTEEKEGVNDALNISAKLKRQAFSGKAAFSGLRKTLAENPFDLRQERTFEDTKSFRCLECQKTFKYRSNLRTHVTSVHGAASYKLKRTRGLTSQDDFLICDVCSHIFKYPVNLRAHAASHSRNKLSSTI